MPAPQDVYGALQQWTASEVSFAGSVWLGEEPERKVLPYCVIVDNGFTTDFQFQSATIETGNVLLQVFAENADSADALGKELRDLYGPADSHVAIPTDGTFQFMAIYPGTPYTLTIEPDPDNRGSRVYQYNLTMTVQISRNY